MSPSHVGHPRKSLSLGNSPLHPKKKGSENGVNDTPRRSFTSCHSMGLSGERTVKRLRLSRALTVPENTSVYEACRRMAARKVDALLLTDSNALLCGILSDKDIATRVIAREVNLEETPVSKVMTKNPVFVLSDTLAVEALQKMVQGKFRHLPVVENGEVIALLDIAKCLYDSLSRMERVVEKGKAIAAAIEGVEKNCGTSILGLNSIVNTIRERLSTIIPENSKIAIVSPEDSVLSATKKMLEMRVNSAVAIVENKPVGILTPRDILMRVITQNQCPESTTVEKVMTPNPECGTIDTAIVDALHIMHDGKFLHLPITDRDGNIVAVLDVLHITKAVVATIGNVSGTSTETANTMMQKFWDSAMSSSPNDDEEDDRSEGSMKLASEGGEVSMKMASERADSSMRLASEGRETGRSPYTVSSMPNTFAFKIQDKNGRMHRFTCDVRNLSDLIAGILQKLGNDINRHNLPQILYEDEDHDKVVLASDEDLATAVDHARSVGWAGLRLHLDCSGIPYRREDLTSGGLDILNGNAQATAYITVAAGAVLIAAMSLLAYLRAGA